MNYPLTAPLTVDLNELREHLAYRARINNTPLHLITWTRDGKVIPVTQAQTDKWLFTGLNHIDFPDILGL